MLKVLIALLVVVEVACLAVLARYAGWRFVLSEVLMSALLGVVVIFCVPARWREAMAVDRSLCSSLTELPDVVRRDAARGHALMLAGVLLILPGLLTDLAGMVLLVLLVADCLYRRRLE